MKKALVLIISLLPTNLCAGGSSGGTPPSLQNDLALMSLVIDDLPKAYADSQNFRRAYMRLGVAGTESTTLSVGKETILVRKLQTSLVDEHITKEILPSDQ